MGIGYRRMVLSLAYAFSATYLDLEMKAYIAAVHLAKFQIHSYGPRLQPFGALADASSRDGMSFGMSSSVTSRHGASRTNTFACHCPVLPRNHLACIQAPLQVIMHDFICCVRRKFDT
jgi:hypothetical protein